MGAEWRLCEKDGTGLSRGACRASAKNCMLRRCSEQPGKRYPTSPEGS